MWLESWLKSIVEMPLALLVVSSCIGLNPYVQRPALCTLYARVCVCSVMAIKMGTFTWQVLMGKGTGNFP